jgi:hypothetical protein
MSNKKNFKVTVYAEIDLDNLKKPPRGTSFSFSVPKELDSMGFFDKDGAPNRMSTMIITNCLVETISANIQVAHQRGHYDSAEHLRDAIGLLEDLFVTNISIDVRDGNPNKK